MHLIAFLTLHHNFTNKARKTCEKNLKSKFIAHYHSSHLQLQLALIFHIIKLYSISSPPLQETDIVDVLEIVFPPL